MLLFGEGAFLALDAEELECASRLACELTALLTPKRRARLIRDHEIDLTDLDGLDQAEVRAILQALKRQFGRRRGRTAAQIRRLINSALAGTLVEGAENHRAVMGWPELPPSQLLDVFETRTQSLRVRLAA